MTIQNTKQWFEAAVPEPTDHNTAIQVGCHLEEVAEMLQALGGCRDFRQDRDAFRKDRDAAIHALTFLANGLKSGIYSFATTSATEYLDALCDQIVTAVGCAHMEGMDIQGALDEVNRSNWSKFVDGKPVFDENGKIKKGPGYSAPELGRFVRESIA